MLLHCIQAFSFKKSFIKEICSRTALNMVEYATVIFCGGQPVPTKTMTAEAAGTRKVKRRGAWKLIIFFLLLSFR
jgi:hypothetical protein